MKKNSFKRFACAATAAALCAGAVFAFTGCTTKHPEITVTYTFNGTDYAVAYKLSRYDAPKPYSILSRLPIRDFTTVCAYTISAKIRSTRADTRWKTARWWKKITFRQ